MKWFSSKSTVDKHVALANNMLSSFVLLISESESRVSHTSYRRNYPTFCHCLNKSDYGILIVVFFYMHPCYL